MLAAAKAGSYGSVGTDYQDYPVTRIKPAASLFLLAALAGCAKKGEIDVSAAGAGITAARSACPIVGVPAATGDVTLFDPATSREASAVDVVATMTDVRGQCDDGGDDVVTRVTFQVNARRTRTEAPRDVTLPYFIAVVRGGNQVSSKRVGAIALHFDAGQATASASGEATTAVSRALATLPEAVRDKLTRRRKAGDEDAAVDPLSTPEVRDAVVAASFEALVGFQLTPEQLRYNATR